MKILHVIASVDPASGGPIEGILRQEEALGGLGLRDIVSLDPPDASFLADYPLRVHAIGLSLPPWAKRIPMARFSYSPRLVPWLLRNAHGYDRIVVNGLWNYAAVGASRALPRLGIPYFVFTHGMMDPWFRRTYPLKHLAKQLFWLLFEGRLAQHAKALLFTTEEEQRLADGQFWGHGYRGQVVGYGTTPPAPPTATQRTAFRATVPALGDRRFLLFMSRIHRKKGCDLLISAFARCAQEFPDLDLVIAGPDRDGLKPRLSEQAREAGVQGRVHWPGMLTGDAKWGAMHGAEAFILPSHQENFGIVVAEAMGCGTPVLITDKVNIWREVKAAEAGLVETDDLAGAEALIRGFLALSKAERARMGQAAKAAFRTYFDVNTTARTMLDVIRGRPDAG